jgi:acetoin utilization deacetylase AcuC-like enzyme
MTLLYTDPLFQKHDTGKRHPETAERLRVVVDHLDKTALAKKCTAGTYKPLAEEQVAKIHSAKQIQSVKQLAEHGGGNVDGDTPVCSESFQVALAAAGACAAAVDAVMKGPEGNALCLVRPPGHHATPTRSMGFCLFNNIALAANHARTAHQLSRILIVDWDVHHGNGTQAIFWNDPNVLFVSSHQWPLYPGSGGAREIGGMDALGLTVNIPLPPGATGDVLVRGFDEVAAPIIDDFAPTWVLVSAGYDGHRADPLANLELSSGDFALIAARVAQFSTPGRLALFLEGGYNLAALRGSVAATLSSLLGGDYRAEASTNGGAGAEEIARTLSERDVALQLAHDVRRAESEH